MLQLKLNVPDWQQAPSYRNLLTGCYFFCSRLASFVHNNRMISKLCFFTKKHLEKFFSDEKNIFSLKIKQVNSEAQYLLLLKSKWHYWWKKILSCSISSCVKDFCQLITQPWELLYYLFVNSVSFKLFVIQKAVFPLYWVLLFVHSLQRSSPGLY